MIQSLSTLESIFFAAREIASPAEQAAFLDQACAGNDDVRRSVERMLAAESGLGSFLEAPALAVDATILQQSLMDDVGTQIGPYKLREVLGEGGMGIVYAAEQEHPVRRRVALKVIKPGMDTREVIARLEAERQALALMDHPNIAKLLDAGTTAEFGIQDSGFRENDAGRSLNPESRLLNPASARPYFVMELVRGLPITDYCDQAKLGLRERLKLFITVCQAIQHAHQKGIIHRDLKPSNVMITLHDGVPVPKIIDFGIAKALNQRLTEHTLYTRNAQLLGTPLYMSPEQAELSGLDVDTRSDVYSLGVLLYELLTGHTPFDKEKLSTAGFDELRHMIRDVEPSRPSQRISTLGQQHLATVASRRGIDERQLSRTIRGELDWIVMKALEKDRNRRYESVAAFSGDVRRFLADEPVEACPPSLVYRLTKILHRHTVALTTTAAVLATLVVATAVSAWLAIDAMNARQVAEERLRAEKQALEREWTAKQRIYPVDIQSAFELLQGGNPVLARDLLLPHAPEPGAPDRRSFEWHYLWGICHARGDSLLGHSAPVYMLEFSPDGELLASASGDDTARLWNVRTGRLHKVLTGHADDVNCVTFSPDGDVLVTASDDHTIGLWNSRTGKQLAILRGHTEMLLGAVYRADGKVIFSASLDGVVKTWDATTKQELKSIQAHDERITAMAISDDGAQLATAAGRTVKVWDTSSLQILWTFADPEENLGILQWLEFRPGTRTLFASWRSGRVRFWDTDQGVQLGGHHLPVSLSALRFSSDRQTMIPMPSEGPLVRLNVDELLPIAAYSFGRFPGHWAVAASPDGSSLATTTNDYTVHLIRDFDRPNYQRLASLDAGVDCLAVMPDGQSALIGCADATWRQIDLASGAELQREAPHPGGVTCARFSPDGALLATGGRDRSLQVRDGSTLSQLRTLTGFADAVLDVAFSVDGSQLAACDGEQVRVWDTETWRIVDEWPAATCRHLDFSDTGGILAAGDILRFRTRDHAMVALHVESRVLAMDGAHTGRFAVLAPDGLFPALFDLQGAVVDGGQPTRLSQHRSNWIIAVALTHDGKTLAATDSRGWTAFWNIATGAKMLTVSLAELTGLPDHFERVSLAFTPDDSTLVFGLTPEQNDNKARHKGVIFAMHAPHVDEPRTSGPPGTTLSRHRHTD